MLFFRLLQQCYRYYKHVNVKETSDYSNLYITFFEKVCFILILHKISTMVL